MSKNEKALVKMVERLLKLVDTPIKVSAIPDGGKLVFADQAKVKPVVESARALLQKIADAEPAPAAK